MSSFSNFTCNMLFVSVHYTEEMTYPGGHSTNFISLSINTCDDKKNK